MRHGLDLVEIGVRVRMWVGVTVMVERGVRGRRE